MTGLLEEAGLPRTLRSPRHDALIAFIIERRKMAGLTQAQVAAKLHRYQSFVATLESGQRRIDVVELIELAETIGFDPRQAIRAVMRVE